LSKADSKLLLSPQKLNPWGTNLGQEWGRRSHREPEVYTQQQQHNPNNTIHTSTLKKGAGFN